MKKEERRQIKHFLDHGIRRMALEMGIRKKIGVTEKTVYKKITGQICMGAGRYENNI